MVLNLLRNVDLANPAHYYAEGVQDHGAASSYADSTSLPILGIEVKIYGDDSTTKAALFRPDGAKASETIPYHNWGANSATKWGAMVSLEDFRKFAQPRALWELRDEAGNVLAAFDLSATILKDSLGNPMVLLTFPQYSPTSGAVTSIAFHWQYFGPDGATVVPVSDLKLLNTLVGTMESWVQDWPTLVHAGAVKLQMGYRFGLYSVAGLIRASFRAGAFLWPGLRSSSRSTTSSIWATTRYSSPFRM